ncbi:hypothetical protein MSG28_013327 [Choristoneura fumiferana]|uniref:Uncharacterized protein n=1 Tax=Choristoneura fumiferana TaxID=7141 RepID=A0ACC0KTG8_CHOFU|nr:hypothetical protein MSG28_013327 [Choristoneura fumiferana]
MVFFSSNAVASGAGPVGRRARDPARRLTLTGNAFGASELFSRRRKIYHRFGKTSDGKKKKLNEETGDLGTATK